MNGSETSGTLIASLLLGVAAFGIFMIEFFLPTGGLLAIMCVLSAIASVVLGFFHSPTLGMSLLALYSVAAPFMVVFGLRMATRSPMGRRMVLSAEDPARTSGSASDQASALPAVGTRGTAITSLRPGGFARFEGRRIDATAEGGLIEAGTEIEVVSLRDGQIRVRARRTSG